jgi:hypothetical protein
MGLQGIERVKPFNLKSYHPAFTNLLPDFDMN